MQVDSIKEIMEQSGFSPEDLTDYQFVRNRLMMRLNNPENDVIRERDQVYRYYLDLMVSYHVILEKNEERMISIPVNYSLMDRWQVTENELYMDALSNIDAINCPVIRTMSEVLLNLGIDTGLHPEYISPEEPPLYVISNNCNNYGAVVILSKSLMKRAADIIEDDFWIIPSSIHEMILAPASIGQQREELEDMVRTINRTQVAPEEVLCDRVYYYDCLSGTIS